MIGDPQCEWISASTGRRCMNVAEKVVHGLAVCHWHVFMATQQLERLPAIPTMSPERLSQLEQRVEQKSVQLDELKVRVKALEDQLHELSRATLSSLVIG